MCTKAEKLVFIVVIEACVLYVDIDVDFNAYSA